jgi:hypothetical protein
MSWIVSFLTLLAFAGQAQSTVIYDSPAQNFIIGIQDLVVTGTTNDDTYDVTFLDGTFDEAFGATTMTADLTFQSSVDAATVVDLINAILNSATPHDLVASATSATTGSLFYLDAFQLPFDADTGYNAKLSIALISTGDWEAGGTIGNGPRDSNSAPQICSTCTTKWAAFTVATVPEPTTIALLSLGLAGMGFTRRRMKA